VAIPLRENVLIFSSHVLTLFLRIGWEIRLGLEHFQRLLNQAQVIEIANT
jgi:hypothetical protein